MTHLTMILPLVRNVAYSVLVVLLLPSHRPILGEYRGCRDPGIGYTQCSSTNDYSWDRNCQRLHGIYPFACYGHQCSPENEAYFLGKLIADSETNPKAPRFLFGDDFNKTDLIGIWTRFVRMEDLADDALEKFDPPENDLEVPTVRLLKVPRVCDPRFHLYCDSSYLRHTTERDVKSICKCHPLYAIPVETDETNDRGDKLFQCHGRPGVPCGYKDDAVHLNQLIDSKNRKMDLEDSRCIKDTTCMDLNGLSWLGPDFVKQYKEGKIFHGFGMSPIMVDYLLQQVERICVCDNRKMWTVMHDCKL